MLDYIAVNILIVVLHSVFTKLVIEVTGQGTQRDFSKLFLPTTCESIFILIKISISIVLINSDHFICFTTLHNVLVALEAQ